MRQYLTFGLLGPAAMYVSIDLVRTAARWWWPQPSIYLVALLPFLVCAVIDRTMKGAAVWERLILTGITAFLASGLACALVYRDLGTWVFGVFAIIPAAGCSLLATATDVAESAPVE